MMKLFIFLGITALSCASFAQTIAFTSSNVSEVEVVDMTNPAVAGLVNTLSNVATAAMADGEEMGLSQSDQNVMAAQAVNSYLMANYPANANDGLSLFSRNAEGINTDTSGNLALANNSGLNILSGIGLCADFSAVASVALTNAGVPNTMLDISTTGGNIADHANLLINGTDTIVNMNFSPAGATTSIANQDGNILGTNTATVVQSINMTNALLIDPKTGGTVGDNIVNVYGGEPQTVSVSNSDGTFTNYTFASSDTEDPRTGFTNVQVASNGQFTAMDASGMFNIKGQIGADGTLTYQAFFGDTAMGDPRSDISVVSAASKTPVNTDILPVSYSPISDQLSPVASTAPGTQGATDAGAGAGSVPQVPAPDTRGIGGMIIETGNNPSDSSAANPAPPVCDQSCLTAEYYAQLTSNPAIAAQQIATYGLAAVTSAFTPEQAAAVAEVAQSGVSGTTPQVNQNSGDGIVLPQNTNSANEVPIRMIDNPSFGSQAPPPPPPSTDTSGEINITIENVNTGETTETTATCTNCGNTVSSTDQDAQDNELEVAATPMDAPDASQDVASQEDNSDYYPSQFGADGSDPSMAAFSNFPATMDCNPSDSNCDGDYGHAFYGND